jgi:translation initiation factor 1
MTKHISTDGAGDLSNNPFGGLNLGGLPDGPNPASGAGKQTKPEKSNGRVAIRREKSGRGGKTVTSLSEFPSHVPLGELDALALKLRKSCACGGTLKGRVIELQGDVRDKAFRELEKIGYKPVLAGG